MMSTRYSITDTSQIITPNLVVFRDLVAENLASMIDVAGDVQRLRPHCKTHKMARVTEMMLRCGITKHKCATVAEAEMLAAAGVKDILLAYNIVGANVARCVEFVRKFSAVDFAVTADHPDPLTQLEAAMREASMTIGVMIDLDCGMHRTGIAAGEEAAALYLQMHESPHLRAMGIHAYDGHHHETDVDVRRAAIEPEWQAVCRFRDQLQAAGMPVPRIVTSGTPGFAIHAQHDDPTVELSPGTTVFYDAGSAANFPDLPFTPAAGVLTRVVSQPGPGLLTFDVGSKAIAADPHVDKRCTFPELPDAVTVMQNEEHLVVRTSQADRFVPGDVQFVIPWHICPTSALYSEALVVVDGCIFESWEVTSRNRRLTI